MSEATFGAVDPSMVAKGIRSWESTKVWTPVGIIASGIVAAIFFVVSIVFVVKYFRLKNKRKKEEEEGEKGNPKSTKDPSSALYTGLILLIPGFIFLATSVITALNFKTSKNVLQNASSEMERNAFFASYGADAKMNEQYAMKTAMYQGAAGAFGSALNAGRGGDNF